MVKFGVEIRAPVKTRPRGIAKSIENAVNKSLGGRDGCKVTSDPPGFFDEPINEETGEKMVGVTVDIIREFKGAGPSPNAISAAIQRGASPGRVISVIPYPSNGIDHGAVQRAIKRRT
ncbi:hypothetical protein MUP77_12410 [Candidatus Bathyarchaeota archaeon]|nr:hypothetical protein [Candidatus Bathyarchaeota archaeon]